MILMYDKSGLLHCILFCDRVISSRKNGAIGTFRANPCLRPFSPPSPAPSPHKINKTWTARAAPACRSRLCRAVLLEAAEAAARMYLPLSPPMSDDGDDDHSAPPPAVGHDIAPICGGPEETRSSLEKIVVPGAAENTRTPENYSVCAAADRPSDPREDSRGGSQVPPALVFKGERAPGGCGDAAQVDRIDLAVGGRGGDSHGCVRGRRPYWRLKSGNSAYCAKRAAMLSTPTFEAWLVAGRDKQQFSVDEDGVVPLAQPSRPPRERAS